MPFAASENSQRLYTIKSTASVFSDIAVYMYQYPVYWIDGKYLIRDGKVFLLLRLKYIVITGALMFHASV